MTVVSDVLAAARGEVMWVVMAMVKACAIYPPCLSEIFRVVVGD